ncbi:hypothetical protein [Bradyrhizobium sp. 33ap4]|uniref:hypothetical protein n=1 Tax=Bradyrhizobium sp. 33ap4 TaxID=3061630 RepID=UPI00292FC14B|nr:hypothetical protein [Bradyrhizobium sp. 33ap4]
MHILDEMSQVIAAGKRAEPIMLASQWYFALSIATDAYARPSAQQLAGSAEQKTPEELLAKLQ